MQAGCRRSEPQRLRPAGDRTDLCDLREHDQIAYVFDQGFSSHRAAICARIHAETAITPSSQRPQGAAHSRAKCPFVEIGSSTAPICQAVELSSGQRATSRALCQSARSPPRCPSLTPPLSMNPPRELRAGERSAGATVREARSSTALPRKFRLRCSTTAFPSP
ncbi:hypothetical protein D3C71_1440410 [compost metagenome]